KPLALPPLEPAPSARRREERLAVAGDHRVDEEPKLVDEAGVDEARRRARAPDEVDVLAGPLLQSRDVRERAEKARLRPERRRQRAREDVVPGLRRRSGPL